MPTPPRVLILGAHPDDADIKAGGTSAHWIDAGGTVLLVSVTDGGAGHQTLRRPHLAQRRKQEAAEAGAVIGAEYRVLDFPDGELTPSLDARRAIIRLIREFRPDLILTHRPADYHPDHRYVAQLVQDAAYMVTVPAVCPETPHLERNPVIAYFSDMFRKPCPFEPHVAIDIGEQVPAVVAMLDKHASQFYEWLPFNAGYADQVPSSPAARLAWLDGRFALRIRPLADSCRATLIRDYGETRGNAIEYVEAFEVSEYGSPLDAAARERMFPFLPAPAVSQSSKSLNWVDMREAE